MLKEQLTEEENQEKKVIKRATNQLEQKSSRNAGQHPPLQHQQSVLSQISSRAIKKQKQHDPAGPVSGVDDGLIDNITDDRGAAYHTVGGVRENQEPATVSYNTKIFNREIMALRSEEQALLKFQNATRMREKH